MAQYVQPPTLYTGQILGKANLSLYVDNDYYFSGIADRWRCIPTGEKRQFIGNEPGPITLWEGYHLLTADAKTLRYYLGAWSNDVSSTVTVKLYYDSVLIDSISSTGAWQYKESTSSLSAKAVGLYYVEATLERTDGNHNGAGLCRAPGTHYTGGSSYTTPPTITDGNTGLAADFNTWRANDLYFDTVTPPQPGFAGLEGGYFASETSRDLWFGWDKHHTDHKRIYYKVYLDRPDPDSSNNIVTLYYDHGGGGEETKVLSAQGWNEGYWDLSGSFTKGNFYRVAAILSRDNSTNNAPATVQYLYITGASQDADFTNMGEFAVDQYVYGNTAGQNTRLSLLSANDAAIYDRLVWGDGNNYAKMHWAVKVPTFARLGGADVGSLSLVRRYDWLYYRTADSATLEWGSDSHTLEDYGDDGYQILDLNSIDLPIGTVYSITGDTVEFAAEIP